MFCIIRAVHLLSVSTLDLIYHVLPPLFCVLFHFIFNDVLSCSSVMSNSLPPFVAHQAPLSMGFPRQEYWNGLLFPPPGDIPDPGIEPTSPVSPSLQADSLPTELHWKLHHSTVWPKLMFLASILTFFCEAFLKLFQSLLKWQHTPFVEYVLKLQPTPHLLLKTRAFLAGCWLP